MAQPGAARALAGTTIEQIAEVFQMFPMTVEGLTDAMAALNRGIRA